MSHYAKVENGLVTKVIVAEAEELEAGLWGGGWVQTSYNTFGGVHPEDRPLRKNYAGIGYAYDPVRDAFIPPQPYPSWVLSEESCLWAAPSEMPDDGYKYYEWNEGSLSWEKSNL